LEQLSESEIDKHFGSLYGLYPDSHDSWSYEESGANSLHGYGSTNNKPFASSTRYAGTADNVDSAWAGEESTHEEANIGFYKRCKAQNVNYTTDEKGISTINTQQNAKDMFRNYVQVIDEQTIVTYLLCIIPLSNFSFFQRMPLIRGAFVDFQFRFNSSLNRINITSDRMEMLDTPLITGSTNPLMISSAGKTNQQPNAEITELTGDTEVVLACGIVKSKDPAVNVSHPQSACMLNATLYSLSPKDEELDNLYGLLFY